MNRIRTIALVGTLALLASPALPQDYREDEAGRPAPPRQPVPAASFWPTPRMMELILDRLVEDKLAQTYNLDEDQVHNTRGLLQERLPRWFNDNRAEIQQLMVEYVETLMGGEPPDSEFVANWAQRTLPLVDGLTEQLDGVATDMRSFLTDDQQITLDGQMAAFHVAIGFVNQKLGVWSEGGFNPETDWIGNPSARQRQHAQEREMQAQMDAAKAEAMGQGSDVPGNPAPAGAKLAQLSATTTTTQALDDWARYVEEFIARYQLNADQQASAHKFLRSAQDQRDAYLSRSKVQAKIDTVAVQIKEAQTDEQRAAGEVALKELNRPLTRMFTTLKERLETLPTRSQRQAVLDQDKPAELAPPQPGSLENSTSQPSAKRESPSSP